MTAHPAVADIAKDSVPVVGQRIGASWRRSTAANAVILSGLRC